MGNGNKTVSDRQQYVVKSNELIRKTRYTLTTQQQKLVLFAISKIRPTDPAGTVYTFSIEDVCKACGVDSKNGYYYRSIKEDIIKLTSRIWIKMPNGKERTVSWIGDAEITPASGNISIQFHSAMEPYLFDLRSHYTQYRLENVLAFKGKYAIRLYEILRSYTTQNFIDSGVERDVSFTVDELREILDVTMYPRWADFDRFVLKRAVDEINEYCDEIHVEYTTHKKGRNISSVNFVITSPGIRQRMSAKQNKRERL